MSAIFPRDAVVRRYLNSGARPGTSRKVVIGAFLGGAVCALVVAGLPVSTLSGSATTPGPQADAKRVAASDCKEHPWMSAHCADTPQRTAAPATMPAIPLAATTITPTPVSPAPPTVVAGTAPAIVSAAPVASASLAPATTPRQVTENPAPPSVTPAASTPAAAPAAALQANAQTLPPAQALAPVPASLASAAFAPPADPSATTPAADLSPTTPPAAAAPAVTPEAARKLAAKKAAHKAAMARLRAEKRTRAARLQEQQRDGDAAAMRDYETPRGGWDYSRVPRPPANVGYSGYGRDGGYYAGRFYRPAPEDYD